ncbi:hypothetical protein [Burkholderia sp. Bp9004]|uniref:hypothetical protein n=1 Tax=Burkholderia sp. Bp9004 TaxID=2184559 RepID=UPI000F5EE254|nr:hypothetical protein [Burkholderia sp. Bp9004]
MTTKILSDACEASPVSCITPAFPDRFLGWPRLPFSSSFTIWQHRREPESERETDDQDAA